VSFALGWGDGGIAPDETPERLALMGRDALPGATGAKPLPERLAGKLVSLPGRPKKRPENHDATAPKPPESALAQEPTGTLDGPSYYALHYCL
jgi:hypothetical protein